MKKITGLLITLLLLLHINSRAQHLEVSPELQAMLNGKTRFHDIMNEVHRYYRSRNYHSTPKLFSEYKKWNRWAWWAARHLNSNGEVDYRTSEVFDLARSTGRLNAANITETQNGQWTAVGPFTTSWAQPLGSRGIGRVDRIVFHPGNPSVVFAGTPAGGIWRSNNGGDNWYSISGTLPNCGVSGIVVSSNDPTGNTLYILTGDGNSSGLYFLTNYGFQTNQLGVLVTTNGGVTWSKLGNSQTVLAGKQCYKLLQLRNFPNVLMVATSSGVFRSTDFGQTWYDADFLGTSIFDIEEHPTNDAIIYASSRSFVLKSTDYGETFPINGTYSPNLINCTRSAIAVTPASPNEVYFLQCGIGNNRLSKSVNSGDSYTAINNDNLISGQYSYNCALAVNRTN
ncbi:MAG: exo-alpha-sialidase, partial [Dinghuibacter sp.]|nr:exo-alpha-sialidase [Dinghuibacter sp.]